MRCILAIVVAVAQIAGPWLCCCGPERVANLFVSTPTPIVKLEAQKSERPAKCPHCAEEAPITPIDNPTEEKQTPSPKPCPCGGVSIVAIVPAVELPSIEGTIEPFEFNFDTVAHYEIVNTIDYPNQRTLPWMTAQDRLYSHHVLRC